MLPAIEIAAGSNKDMQAAFSFIYSSVTVPRFAVTLFPTQPGMEYDAAWIEDFMLLLAHSGYLREDNQRIVFIDNASQVCEDTAEWILQLQNRCNENGFSFVAVWLNKCTVYDDEVVKTSYPGTVYRYTDQNEMERILTTAVAPVSIYIQTDNVILENVYAALDQVIGSFQSRNPIQYQLLLRLTAGMKEKQALQQKLKEYTLTLQASQQYQALWLQETAPQETIGTGGVIHQVNRIKRFYWEEYEVLPLWYKRLGHLIKVITGKRKFRTLFGKRKT